MQLKIAGSSSSPIDATQSPKEAPKPNPWSPHRVPKGRLGQAVDSSEGPKRCSNQCWFLEFMCFGFCQVMSLCIIGICMMFSVYMGQSNQGLGKCSYRLIDTHRSCWCKESLVDRSSWGCAACINKGPY